VRARASLVQTSTTPEALRAEGILEIGRAPGTSVLYVRTRVKFHVLHVTWLPDRRLDDYSVRLAVSWIENQGMPSCEVASNLGVTADVLRKALLAAGYERVAGVERKRGSQRGHRRGRFMRRAELSVTT